MNLTGDTLRRARRGWYLYDWASSAFATVILAALLPVYFAETVVPAEGLRWLGLHWSATSLWGYASGLSALLIFLVAPWLGALADAAASRRRWLLGLFLPGAAATTLLVTIGPGDVVRALVLYVASASAFVAANIFYDAFLPLLGGPAERDRLSARGYAWGYLGGGLIFLLDILLIRNAARLGLDPLWAARLALAAAGIWWGGFGLLAWRRLVEPPAAAPPPRGRALAAEALRRIRGTLGEVVRRRDLGLFLAAFLLYNDGIQTVVKMASIYGKDELGFGTGTLLGTLLMVQLVGIAGALLFGRLAGRMGTRGALLASLVVWLGVTVWGYRIQSPWEFWALGGAVGLCLGGTQALSRSFFTRWIPAGRSAEYYGFYSVVAKFSAVGGPILFALIRQATGTARLSILALSGFFVVGIALLAALRPPRANGTAV